MNDYSKNKSIKFAKLKKLYIDISSVPAHLLCKFDLLSCSDTLKIFCIYDSTSFDDKELKMIKKFLSSTKDLTNLETLSFDMPSFNACILDSTVHLKKLR